MFENSAYALENRNLRLVEIKIDKTFNPKHFFSLEEGNSQFGYSISCDSSSVMPDDAVVMAVSEYRGNKEGGSVYVATKSVLQNYRDGALEDFVKISGKPPSLTMRQHFLNFLRRIFGGTIAKPYGWFGHDVHLFDQNQDGYPDFLVGARLEHGRRGAAYYIDGKKLSKTLKNGEKELRIDLLLKNKVASKIIPEKGIADEFGFSVLQTPFVFGETGPNIFIRASSTKAGESHKSILFSLKTPAKAGEYYATETQIIEISESDKADFGRTLSYSAKDNPEIVIGSYPNSPISEETIPNAKAWSLTSETDEFITREIFNSKNIENAKQVHLTPLKVNFGGHQYLTLAVTSPWVNGENAEGIVVVDSITENVIMFSNLEFSGAHFGWAVLNSDVDNDGYDDIIVTANEYKAFGSTGAVILINGKQIYDSLTKPHIEPIAKVLLFPDNKIEKLGSKRRQCAYKNEQNHTVLAVGSPYGSNSLSMITIQNNFFNPVSK